MDMCQRASDLTQRIVSGAPNAIGSWGQSNVELGHFNIYEIVFRHVALLCKQKAGLC